MSTTHDATRSSSGLAEALPDPGPERWWRITHRPAQRQAPIRVELMEHVVPGRKPLSTVIGYENTIAAVKSIAQTADLILTRVGDYAKVVGEYGRD